MVVSVKDIFKKKGHTRDNCSWHQINYHYLKYPRLKGFPSSR